MKAVMPETWALSSTISLMSFTAKTVSSAEVEESKKTAINDSFPL